MLSKRFTDSSGTLWYFNSPEGRHGVKSASTKGAFWLKHHNTVTLNSGEKLTLAEGAFNIVENPANHLLNFISAEVRQRRFPDLDNDARGLLDLFLLYQFKRSPDVINPIMARLDHRARLAEITQLFEEMFGQPVAPGQLQALMTPENLERVATFERIMAVLDTGEEARAVLNNRGLHFAIAPEGRAFVIGSNPVIRWEGHLAEAYALVMPIASDLLLLYGHPEQQGRILEVDAAGVRQTNEKMWTQSTALGGCDERLVTSLVRRHLPRPRQAN